SAQVGTAASRILVAIYSRVAGELAEAERKAALLRAELRAVDSYITGDLKSATIPNAVATLLANPAAAVEDPVGYQLREGLHNARTSKWRDLMKRLVAGDADADL